MREYAHQFATHWPAAWRWFVPWGYRFSAFLLFQNWFLYGLCGLPQTEHTAIFAYASIYAGSYMFSLILATEFIGFWLHWYEKRTPARATIQRH